MEQLLPQAQSFSSRSAECPGFVSTFHPDTAHAGAAAPFTSEGHSVPSVQTWSALAELLPGIHHTPEHCHRFPGTETGWVYFKETGSLTKHILNLVISGIFGHCSLQVWAFLCQLCLSNHLPRESFHTALGSLTAAVNPWLAHPR